MADSPLEEAQVRALVERAQAGDHEAFAALYDHFFTPIYRYSAFRLPAEIAEDVTADVFVKAWEKLHTYKTQANVPFAAWLFRIARHAVIDTYRTRRGFEEVSEELPDTDTFNQAEHRLHQQDTLRVVRHALSRLPRRYREILVLTFMSDLSHSEVARTLRLTEGAVRILKLRALRKLATFLPKEIAERA